MILLIYFLLSVWERYLVPLPECSLAIETERIGRPLIMAVLLPKHITCLDGSLMWFGSLVWIALQTGATSFFIKWHWIVAILKSSYKRIFSLQFYGLSWQLSATVADVETDSSSTDQYEFSETTYVLQHSIDVLPDRDVYTIQCFWNYLNFTFHVISNQPLKQGLL